MSKIEHIPLFLFWNNLWQVYSYAGRNPLTAPTSLVKNDRDFDPKKFLATIGEGRKSVAVPQKQTIFAQGDAADAVFYIQGGKVRLTVVSKIGKEATLGILNEGEFFGEGGLVLPQLEMEKAFVR